MEGKTLGADRDKDSGLIQITDKGNYPFVEMGKSSDLKEGQWCIAVGHPRYPSPPRIKIRTPVPPPSLPLRFGSCVGRSADWATSSFLPCDLESNVSCA